MEIEVKIDSSRTEPKLVIITDKITQPIQELIRSLSKDSPQFLIGFQDAHAKMLEPAQILRVYITAGKVYAATAQETYRLRLRLYEAEEQLYGAGFVRISQSELVNLRKIKNFDLSLSGTICVRLTDGTITYVSRRYIGKIKQILGI